MRLFRCDACGHRMRLGGDACGKCFEPKPVLKSPRFLGIVGVVAVVALTVTLAIVAGVTRP